MRRHGTEAPAVMAAVAQFRLAAVSALRRPMTWITLSEALWAHHTYVSERGDAGISLEVMLEPSERHLCGLFIANGDNEQGGLFPDAGLPG